MKAEVRSKCKKKPHVRPTPEEAINHVFDDVAEWEANGGGTVGQLYVEQLNEKEAALIAIGGLAKLALKSVECCGGTKRQLTRFFQMFLNEIVWVTEVYESSHDPLEGIDDEDIYISSIACRARRTRMPVRSPAARP